MVVMEAVVELYRHHHHIEEILNQGKEMEIKNREAEVEVKRDIEDQHLIHKIEEIDIQMVEVVGIIMKEIVMEIGKKVGLSLNLIVEANTNLYQNNLAVIIFQKIRKINQKKILNIRMFQS